MRITTSQLFQRGIDSILRQQSSTLELQQQIASGKKLSKPSDDPINSSRIQFIMQELSQIDRMQSNADSAKSALQSEEALLGSMTNALQRIRELYIQANTGVLDSATRTGIIVELEERLDSLVASANSRDYNGDYIFSGYQNQIKPISQAANGQYVYNGDDGQKVLQVTSSTFIPTSDSGFDLFENIPSGNGIFSVTDAAPANTGSGIISSGFIFDQAAYVKDSYTINFIDNAGTLEYEVRDSSLAVVTSGTFVSGEAMKFNGIEFSVTGEPSDGDNFLVSPSSGKNMFNSIRNTIDSLKDFGVNATQVAKTQNEFNQGLEELDQALSRLNITKTKIGSRLNSIDSAVTINEDFKLKNKQLLSSLEDLDLAEAIVQLNSESIALEAAQQSFLRIQNLSLFNFL